MERQVKLYIGNAAEFKPENYYEIDNYTVNDNGDVFDSSGNKLKEYTRYGYKYVWLEINGKEKLCKVHRIVACTFRDICGEFNEVVNHLDENKFNNSAYNLQWTTNYENLHYGTIKERAKQSAEINRKLKEIVKELYEERGIKYTKNVKIKKLRTCYKIKDKLNKITLYTQGKDFILDRNRSDLIL
jgi:hypothetical protein